jgi:hypothetical protein
MDMVSQRPSKNLCLCLIEEVKKLEGGWTTLSRKWMDRWMDGSAFLCLLFFIFLLRPSGNALSDMFRKSEVICDLLQNTIICEHIYSVYYVEPG